MSTATTTKAQGRPASHWSGLAKRCLSARSKLITLGGQFPDGAVGHAFRGVSLDQLANAAHRLERLAASQGSMSAFSGPIEMLRGRKDSQSKLSRAEWAKAVASLNDASADLRKVGEKPQGSPGANPWLSSSTGSPTRPRCGLGCPKSPGFQRRSKRLRRDPERSEDGSIRMAPRQRPSSRTSRSRPRWRPPGLRRSRITK